MIPVADVSVWKAQVEFPFSAKLAVVEALAALGELRPKYPALSTTATARAFLSMHLRANNRRAGDGERRECAARLRLFTERCRLIEAIIDEDGGAVIERLGRPVDEVLFELDVAKANKPVVHSPMAPV